MRSRAIQITVLLLSISLASGYLYFASRPKNEGGNQKPNSNTTDGAAKVDPEVLMSSSKSKIVPMGKVIQIDRIPDDAIEPEEPMEGKPEPKPSQELAPSSKSPGILLSKEKLDGLLEDAKKKKAADKSGDAPEP